MVMERNDVLVIGGGIIGVCTAYYLAERGVNVTLIERDEICSGASYGNAGLIVPSHSVPLSAPGVVAKGLKWLLNPESPLYIRFRLDFDLFAWLLRFWRSCTEEHVRKSLPLLITLQRDSLNLFEKFSSEGLAFGLQKKGTMTVFNTEQAFEDGVKEAELLREHGLKSEILTAEKAREKEPLLSEKIVGGVYFPDDAHLDPAAFVISLAGKAQQAGVNILTHTEVIELKSSGRSITSVRTTKGEWKADLVVLAAGAWSATLTRNLDIKLPIQPAKGYSITIQNPERIPSLPLMLNEVRVAVTPLNGRLRLGGTLELAGLDLSINQRRVDAIRRGASQYLPEIKGEGEEIWRGLRPCTPDGLPVIGRPSNLDNLIIASGHGILGISLGPITGKIVAQMVCGETLDYDLNLLNPDRFR
ncbi:MAG: FAD-dependent oxidoreductase [Armatimonadota bacterium]|nr:FAD-dependent oxidoreductase [Armatimonadota bacterium]MDW8144232.1 FAD-dependent oxidoreductase [Armatimonadota bacterium]